MTDKEGKERRMTKNRRGRKGGREAGREGSKIVKRVYFRQCLCVCVAYLHSYTCVYTNKPSKDIHIASGRRQREKKK